MFIFAYIGNNVSFKLNVVKFLMRIVYYELLGFCFDFRKQLFNFKRLEIENRF